MVQLVQILVFGLGKIPSRFRHCPVFGRPDLGILLYVCGNMRLDRNILKMHPKGVQTFKKIEFTYVSEL